MSKIVFAIGGFGFFERARDDCFYNPANRILIGTPLQPPLIFCHCWLDRFSDGCSSASANIRIQSTSPTCRAQSLSRLLSYVA
jgi:hypothetical protein